MSASFETSSDPTTASTSSSILSPGSSISSLINSSTTTSSDSPGIPTPSTLAASVDVVAETLPKYLIQGGVALGVVILIGLALTWWKLKMRRNRHFDEEDHYWCQTRRERLGSNAPCTPRKGSDQTVVGLTSNGKGGDSPDSEKTLVGDTSGSESSKDLLTSPLSGSTSPTSPKSSTFLIPLPAPTSLDNEPYVLISRSSTSSPRSPESSLLPKDGTASLPLPTTRLSGVSVRLGLKDKGGSVQSQEERGKSGELKGALAEEHHVPVLSREQ